MQTSIAIFRDIQTYLYGAAAHGGTALLCIVKNDKPPAFVAVLFLIPDNLCLLNYVCPTIGAANAVSERAWLTPGQRRVASAHAAASARMPERQGSAAGERADKGEPGGGSVLLPPESDIRPSCVFPFPRTPFHRRPCLR